MTLQLIFGCCFAGIVLGAVFGRSFGVRKPWGGLACLFVGGSFPWLQLWLPVDKTLVMLSIGGGVFVLAFGFAFFLSYWVFQLLRELAEAKAEAPETMPLEGAAVGYSGPFGHLVLCGLLFVGFLLCKAHLGRATAHLFLAGGACCWLPSFRTRKIPVLFHSNGWSFSLLFWLFGVLIVWGTSPSFLFEHELLASTKVDGEPVNILVKEKEGKKHYSVLASKRFVFQSAESYRYAEMMVHPAISMLPRVPKNVLLVGGDDHGVVRELAKYASIQRMELWWWGLFPSWKRFFRSAPVLRWLHPQLLSRANWREDTHLPFDNAKQLFAKSSTLPNASMDLILLDYPMPEQSLKLLFDVTFSKQLLDKLHPKGILVAHLGSPYMARERFWCLVGRWAKLRHYVLPYRLAPALYRDHGFIMVSKKPFSKKNIGLHIQVPTQFLYQKQPFSVFRHFPSETLSNRDLMVDSCFGASASFQK